MQLEMEWWFGSHTSGIKHETFEELSEASPATFCRRPSYQGGDISILLL